MTRKNILSAAVLAATLVTISSCDDKDLYDPNYAIEKARAEYDANFIAKFGDVSQVTSWDFSSGEAELATRATSEITCTNVAGLDFGVTNVTVNTQKKGTNNKYLVESTLTKNTDLKTSITEALPDQTSHDAQDVVLTAPSNSFTIYPVFAQGAFQYEMWVKITDYNNPNNVKSIKVFTKDWTEYNQAYYNGMGTDYTSSTKSFAPYDGGNQGGNPGDGQGGNPGGNQGDGQGGNPGGNPGDNKTTYTVTSYANLTGATFEAPVGSSIEIYVKLLDGDDNNPAGTCYGTSTGNAIIVDCDTKPEGVTTDIMPDNAVIKYIGIEDSNVSDEGTDKDYNDLVCVLIGNPDVPQPIVITEDEYTVETAHPCKRYMIEDLGNTDDFDFNDLVVDIEAVESTTYKVTKTNGTITKTEVKSKTSGKQVAYVRAMGGTKDFTLKIGNSTWTKSENNFEAGTMYNTTEGSIDTENYLAKINLPDNSWVPDDNNVSVTVGAEGSTDATTITFGEAGHAPLMIATDRSQAWSAERTSADWIKEKMKQ